MSFGSFRNDVIYKLFTYKSYIFSIYMYKQDLALNSPQGLICHKTQSTNNFMVSSDLQSYDNNNNNLFAYSYDFK